MWWRRKCSAELWLIWIVDWNRRCSLAKVLEKRCCYGGWHSEAQTEHHGFGLHTDKCGRKVKSRRVMASGQSRYLTRYTNDLPDDSRRQHQGKALFPYLKAHTRFVVSGSAHFTFTFPGCFGPRASYSGMNKLVSRCARFDDLALPLENAGEREELFQRIRYEWGSKAKDTGQICGVLRNHNRDRAFWWHGDQGDRGWIRERRRVPTESILIH